MTGKPKELMLKWGSGEFCLLFILKIKTKLLKKPPKAYMLHRGFIKPFRTNRGDVKGGCEMRTAIG